jgi:tRNA threonylcarbamoyladenosine biosynthesis protein TsaE
MNTQFFTLTLSQMSDFVAHELVPLVGAVRVVTFTGPLGSGKTTTIKELIRQLGSLETVTSPTFNYVNNYRVKDLLIQHFDLYRLESPEELEELGLHENIGLPGTISCIEWPAIATPFIDSLREQGLVVDLEFLYDPQNLALRNIKMSHSLAL